MSEYNPIIDVTPIDHSSEGANRPHVNSSSKSSSYQQPSWKTSSGYRAPGSAYTRGAAPIPPFGTAYSYGTTDTTAASKTGGSVIGGIAQIAVGTGLIMIGIPMLILPGPGLLSIAGGFALAANGTRKLFS